MTRHTDRLAAHARAIARETGLDYTRVRKVIGRTARDRMGLVIPEDSAVDPHDSEVQFWPDLREGFSYLAPERAIKMFEDVDVDQLGTRLLVADHWKRSGPPLFRVPELRAHLSALHAFLQYPHQNMLRTGFPSTIFGESAWLRQRLASLYPVKQPSVAEIAPEASGRLRIHYMWTRVPWAFVLNASGPITIYRRGKGITAVDPGDYCDYSEAPPLDGLTSEKIDTIEALRPRVLGFKMEMLRLLLNDDRPMKDRVGKCLDLLSRSFAAGDADVLLQVDRIFSQLEVQEVVEGTEAWNEGAGGITDVLNLVLLVESLERWRAVEGVRDLLERHDLISKERFSDPRPAFRSYFEVVDQPFEPIVTNAMALFLDASHEAAPFLEDALGRIQRAMPTEAAFRWPVWGQDAADFSILVTEYVRWQQRQKAIAGRYGALDFACAGGRRADRKPEQGHANVFRRAPHGTWAFQFAGKSISTDKGPKGLSTIAYLLRNADTDCPVMDIAAISASGTPPADTRPRGMNEVVLSAEGLSIGSPGDSGDVLDAKARSAYRERRRAILSELDEAERDGDLARIQRLKGELEALDTELSRAIGLGDRQRKAGDPLERARKTVSKQINVGLEFFKERHPELYVHLRSRLDYALYVWVYRSVPGVTWDT